MNKSPLMEAIKSDQDTLKADRGTEQLTDITEEMKLRNGIIETGEKVQRVLNDVWLINTELVSLNKKITQVVEQRKLRK